MKKFVCNNSFIIILIVSFIILDSIIAFADPINTSVYFYKTDIEKVRMIHPKKVWDKVFFGNSIVIASFIEEKSVSGYINAGIDYGKLTDLDKMLNNRVINVKDDLVVGLNFFTLMDNLPTNPYYEWHRPTYEPYVFFYREQFQNFIKDNIKNIIQKKKFELIKYMSTDRELYYGKLSKDELDKKVKDYENNYGKLSINDFSCNIKSLSRVIDFCDKNNIRLRIVWMPWNSYYTPPKYVQELKTKVNEILKENNIEVLDLSNKFNSSDFHDLGHLNREEGAVKFTEEVDKWLIK